MTAEVQALQEALRAQEHEDEGELGLALDAYYRASCQLSYLADTTAEKGSALAQLCGGLLQLFEQRVTVSANGCLLAARVCLCSMLQHIQFFKDRILA